MVNGLSERLTKRHNLRRGKDTPPLFPPKYLQKFSRYAVVQFENTYV